MAKTAWLRRASSYATAVTMACFGITGMASAQTITNTGPGSTSTITTTNTDTCNIINNNNVSAASSNTQNASSGDATVSGNTSAGVPWTGWGDLDPSTWQQNGQSYPQWWSGVLAWVTDHASGAGWNSDNSNLSWNGGSDWNSWDPMVWQQNGQSFDNWFAGVQGYMNNNSANWLLTWPSGDNSNGDSQFNEGGATTGDVSNYNNASFSVNINNNLAPSFMSVAKACGGSAPTMLPPSNGPGTSSQGSNGPAPMVAGAFRSTPHAASFGNGGSSSFRPATKSVTPVASVPAAPAAVSLPSGGMGGGTPVVTPPAAPAGNSISNTGPDSSASITSNTTTTTSITNNNNVYVNTSNTQNASSGDATASGNTTTGGGGSGDASNGNTAGGSIGVNN